MSTTANTTVVQTYSILGGTVCECECGATCVKIRPLQPNQVGLFTHLSGQPVLLDFDGTAHSCPADAFESGWSK
jgi:hypothetical protein